MITITTQGKTYQIVDLKGRIKSTIEEWISAGYLEEVKENKDHSILEKLLDDLIKIENRYKKSFEDTNDEYYQGGWAVACKIIGLLTSLETKKCDHVSDGVVYTSNPPQYKCSKCGVYSTEFMPIETKEEPQPQEDIELLSFTSKNHINTWGINHPEGYRVLTEHLERLTSTVNQLIKANKKPL